MTFEEDASAYRDDLRRAASQLTLRAPAMAERPPGGRRVVVVVGVLTVILLSSITIQVSRQTVPIGELGQQAPAASAVHPISMSDVRGVAVMDDALVLLNPNEVRLVSTDGTSEEMPLAPEGMGRAKLVRAGSSGVLLLASGFGGSDVRAARLELGTEWEPIATPPWPESYEVEAVWTGEVVLAWASPYRVPDQPSVLASYDPARNVWAVLDSGPLSNRWSSGVSWDGSRLIVFGGSNAETDLGDGASYSPESRQWVELPPGPPRSNPTVYADADEVLVTGGAHVLDSPQPQRFDRASGVWDVLRDVAPNLTGAFLYVPAHVPSDLLRGTESCPMEVVRHDTVVAGVYRATESSPCAGEGWITVP